MLRVGLIRLLNGLKNGLRMASVNKIRKARNAYCSCALKQGLGRLKRIYFYDSSQRKRDKKIRNEENE